MIKFLFKLVWRKWFNKGDNLIKIRGWNKALIDDIWGARRSTTFLLRGME